MNLQIYILKEVIALQCAGAVGGAGVPLSDFRRGVGIPGSTFHRAVRSLVDARIIERVSRDRYSVSIDVLNQCELISKDMRNV